jgi:hypothetical protein
VAAGGLEEEGAGGGVVGGGWQVTAQAQGGRGGCGADGGLGGGSSAGSGPHLMAVHRAIYLTFSSAQLTRAWRLSRRAGYLSRCRGDKGSWIIFGGARRHGEGPVVPR